MSSPFPLLSFTTLSFSFDDVISLSLFLIENIRKHFRNYPSFRNKENVLATVPSLPVDASFYNHPLGDVGFLNKNTFKISLVGHPVRLSDLEV